MLCGLPAEVGDAAAYADARGGTGPQGREAELRRRHWRREEGGSGAGQRYSRSFSPPTNEELDQIEKDSARRAGRKAAGAARAEEIERVKKDEKEGEGSSRTDRAADAGWSLTPLADWESAATVPPPAKSMLSAAVSDDHLRVGGGGMHRMQRGANIRVYCPFLPAGPTGKPHVAELRISDQATVIEVVRLTLRDLPGNTRCSPHPDHYGLYAAESDSGKIDDDLPVLEKKIKVRSMGFSSFVLCCTKQYRSMPARPVLPHALEDVTVKVAMEPSKSRRVARVQMPPDIVFEDALKFICEHLHKDHKKFELLIDSSRLPDDLIPASNRTMGTLFRVYGLQEVTLKSKGREMIDSDGSDTETADQSAQFCNWDEATASRYTEYDVVKINKFGSRQARVLGVDRDKIYNMMRGLRAQKTKNPERSIMDIAVVRVFPDRPCYFEIDYRPGVCKSGRDQIECASAQEAHEIVTKVKFLQDLSRPHHKVDAGKEAGGKEDREQLRTGMGRFFVGLRPAPVLSSPRGDPK